MSKNTILLLLTIYTMQSFAQKNDKYLINSIELEAVNFSTFHVADFYSKAGGLIYKKPVSGITDSSLFGYVYGTNMEGQGDTAGTFGGVVYYAISMVVTKTGRLIGVCASAIPATRQVIEKRLHAMEGKYGTFAVAASKKQYVFAKGEKYVQVSLLQAIDDYNKPISDTYTTRLYILDKSYVEKIKEGVNGNEFAALNGQ